MIDLDNQTDKKFDIDFLEKILASQTDKDVELIITYNQQIQQINDEFRQKNEPTDVLSFPLDGENMPLGSIVISIDFVEEKSKKFRHKEDDELALLFIHGLLHLLDFDHEIDDGEHRKKEEELIKKFDLPDSLIVRNI